ncbi:hypothetical protein S83_007691 [Arachis hypogaea]|nr:uncharacterized protein DS421_3g74980 [Arachis hypogaea]
MRFLARRMNEKPSPRFYGPFEVLERVGTVAYRLTLADRCKLRPVFHVSKLKKVVSTSQQPQVLPPVMAEDGELIMQPVGILASRSAGDGSLRVLGSLARSSIMRR